MAPLDHRIARLVAKFAADFYEYFLPHEFSHFPFYAFSFWEFHTAVISQKIQDTAKECKGGEEEEERRRRRRDKPQRTEKTFLLCRKFIKLPLGQIGGAA